MRGVILTWSGEKGIVAASNVRYPITIEQWAGNIAPKPDMKVELIFEGETITSVQAISTEDLAQEKAGEIADKLKRFGNRLYQEAGKSIVIAYGVFAVAAIFLNLVTVSGSGCSLSCSLNGAFDNSGRSNDLFGWLLTLAAIASIAGPTLVKHKFAPLAYCLPLLVTLSANLKVYQFSSNLKKDQAFTNDLIKQFGNSYGSEYAAQSEKALSEAFHFGISGYVIPLVAIFLAYRGVRIYLDAQKRAGI